MILPRPASSSVTRYRRGRVRSLRHRSPMIRRLPPLSSTFRRGARSAISRCRSHSSWRDGCARRRGRSRRRSSDSSGASTAFARIEAAPNGYINFFLDRRAPSRRLAERRRGGAGGRLREKAIVEHTAINPNKAAHIGHLRNAALGDAFGRLLRFLGRAVEIQNYIDDTGVQVADVAVGFRELEGKDLAGVRAHRGHDPVRLLLLGPLRAGHRVVRSRQGRA